jgi:CHAT domain-containing protein
LLAAAGRTDEAFTAAEQTKARVLAEVLGNGRLRISKGMTAAEREREETLRRRLVAARQSHVAARAETNRAAAEYAEFQTALYAGHPELALRRTAFDPPSAAAVAAQLNPGTAAVEYFIGSDAVFAMVIGAGDATVHFYKLAVSPKIVLQQAAAFRTALATRALGFQPLARALYAELLEPLREIRGKKGIVLVPDGALWNLPFQAMQSANGKYTIENAAVSYAPSMTVLAALRRRANRTPTATPSVLALGNPALSSASNLPLLPLAEKEVTDIGSLYGAAHSRVLTGARAAKSALNGNRVHYDVLHLATHGVLDPRQPMYSHLWLAPEGGDQGMLEAWEVMNLDLREEVVVLSACETARGAIGDGEGLLGMSWAMFVAGAPTTVASQWKVDAASTTALMTGFHRGLRESMMRRAPQFSKAEALRQATLETLAKAEFRHPFYWAAFVMLGDGS